MLCLFNAKVLILLIMNNGRLNFILLMGENIGGDIGIVLEVIHCHFIGDYGAIDVSIYCSFAQFDKKQETSV